MNRLELQRHPIVRCLDLQLAATLGHLVPEMGQDQTTTVESVAVFSELFEAQMEIERGVMKGAFADEEVASRDPLR